MMANKLRKIKAPEGRQFGSNKVTRKYSPVGATV
jgi:hypothetical protein